MSDVSDVLAVVSMGIFYFYFFLETRCFYKPEKWHLAISLIWRKASPLSINPMTDEEPLNWTSLSKWLDYPLKQKYIKMHRTSSIMTELQDSDLSTSLTQCCELTCMDQLLSLRTIDCYTHNLVFRRKTNRSVYQTGLSRVELLCRKWRPPSVCRPTRQTAVRSYFQTSDLFCLYPNLKTRWGLP